MNRKTLVAVETVLKMNGGGPMKVAHIVEYAKHFHVNLNCRSKTPENTVARDLYCDIKDNGYASRFRRVAPGLFRLCYCHELGTISRGAGDVCRACEQAGV